MTQYTNTNKSHDFNLEGTTQVFERLFDKKHLLENGDEAHKNIRPLLIVMHGSMSGVYGGAQVTALYEHGLNQVFDTVIGVSTGAPTVAYFLSGQPALGTSIYYEELVDNNFISLFRGLRGESIIDMDFLCDVFRGGFGNKKLNIAGIRASRTKMLIASTKYDTGEGVLFDASRYEDVVELLKASSAQPILYKGDVVIDGIKYVDGGIGLPFPDHEIIESINPTDILVLTNRHSVESRPALSYKLFGNFVMRNLPDIIRDKILNQDDIIRNNMDQMRADNSRNYAFVWCSDEVHPNDLDRDKLVRAKNEAYRHMSDILSEMTN